MADKVLTPEEIQSGEIRPEKPQPKFFEFGDAFFECNRCGNYERLQKGIKDGIQFVLPTSDQHEWRLTCGKCKNMMRIFFKESDEETIAEAKAKIAEEEAKKKEEAGQVALEKAKKEDNESKTKSKKKRSAKRSSKVVERSDSDDGTGETTPTSTD
jgi:hypothetical protein